MPRPDVDVFYDGDCPLYRTFAKNRLTWTGRCNPDGSCRVPAHHAPATN